jgi:hypothetical protein
MLNESLDWQPSHFINIVGKDDFIQQCSHLAGLKGCHSAIVIFISFTELFYYRITLVKHIRGINFEILKQMAEKHPCECQWSLFFSELKYKF